MKKRNIVKTKRDFNNIINNGVCIKNKYYVIIKIMIILEFQLEKK